MKIKLEYSDLTITIDADGLPAAMDAILAAAAVLSKLTELGYGKPTVTMDTEDLKGE